MVLVDLSVVTSISAKILLPASALIIALSGLSKNSIALSPVISSIKLFIAAVSAATDVGLVIVHWPSFFEAQVFSWARPSLMAETSDDLRLNSRFCRRSNSDLPVDVAMY